MNFAVEPVATLNSVVPVVVAVVLIILIARFFWR
jgi:hypothetical protein